MTIFDIHTHLGSKPEILQGTADGLIASMDQAGIDRALVFAGTVNGCTNAVAMQQADLYPERLRAVAAVSPLEPECSPDDVVGWHQVGRIAAVKFYPGYEHFFPHGDCVRPYLEAMARNGIPAIFHAGDLFRNIAGGRLRFCHPLEIDDLAVALPTLKIIIAHCGWPFVRETALVCQKNVNVYADFSGFTYGGFTGTATTDFKEMLAQFRQVCPDSAKIMFGSDWPISDQTSYVRTAREALAAVYLSGGGRSPPPDVLAARREIGGRIMAGNAARVFGLEKWVFGP